MKRVTIMRGIPGSGKTTWVRRNRPGAYVCSADDFHRNEDGVYEFKRENAGPAHNNCLWKFTYAIVVRELYDIVVDNTNVKVFEIAPYYRIAEAFGYEVEVRCILCDPVRGTARTVHAVPLETVMAMANGFEPLPAWWKTSVEITHTVDVSGG